MASIDKIKVGNITYDIIGGGDAVSEIYSTTEKKVGKWIDGKDIYQKTFSVSIPACTDGTEATSSYFAVGAKVSSYVDYDISFKTASSGVWSNCVSLTSGKWFRMVFYDNTNTGHPNTFYIRNAWATFNNGTAYVTLRYTKV